MKNQWVRTLLTTLKTLLIASILALATPLMAANPHPSVIKVGTSGDYAPFEFYKDGHLTGFDIDLAQALAKQLQVEARCMDMDFSSLIPSLQTGKVDLIISSLTPTAERRENVDFSQIYYYAPIALLSAKDHPVRDMGELAEKKVGVQLGSMFEVFVKKQSDKINHLTVVSLTKIPQLVQELKLKRIDAIVIDQAQADAITLLQPELTSTPLKHEKADGFAIAFPKDSPLREKIDQALQKLQKNGEIERLKQKWKLSSS